MRQDSIGSWTITDIIDCSFQSFYQSIWK